MMITILAILLMMSAYFLVLYRDGYIVRSSE